jgi:parallel beta-helix repeat protein
MFARLVACGLVATAALLLAAAPAEPAATNGLRYTGPAVVSDLSVLRAQAPRNVVAVTYLVDGRPVATATAAPFALRLTRGDIRPGRHHLWLQAVTNNGTRRLSRWVRIQALGSAGPTITASPSRRLGAALAALAHGHATVVLDPGVYRLHDVRLGDGARLAGRPGTILRAPTSRYSNVLLVDGRDVRVSNLTIDGGGPGPGDGEAIAVGPSARTFRASRVRVVRIRRAGLYAWGSFHDISIQDSLLTSNGSADGAAIVGLHEGGSHASVVRCRIAGFRGWGINFAQSAYRRLDMGWHAVALDNVVTDVDDPSRANGTDEGGIWSGGPGAAIVGNTIRRATWDGIETVGSSERSLIAGNLVTDTRTGIYLEHATNNSVIARNTIRRVGTGINVEWRYGDVGSSDNRFVRNTVTQASKAGIFVDVGSDRNALSDNRISSTPNGIVLQGASRNLVTRNLLCGPQPPSISQTTGVWDNGTPAQPAQNLIQNNRVARAC